MPICQRCNKDSRITRGSRFNTDVICIPCIDIEKKHPDYPRAAAAEHAEVLKGNYNFPGIGKPIDL